MMKFTMQDPRRKKKPTKVWPPPELMLPSAEELRRLDPNEDTINRMLDEASIEAVGQAAPELPKRTTTLLLVD